MQVFALSIFFTALLSDDTVHSDQADAADTRCGSGGARRPPPSSAPPPKKKGEKGKGKQRKRKGERERET